MRLHVDLEADALTFRLDDARIVDSQQVAPGVVLDYNEKGVVVGVEILNLSSRTSKLNLQSILFETSQPEAASAVHEPPTGYQRIPD